MAIYDDIRAKIEELGGSQGPVGSINVNGGREIKIRYQPLPDPGFRVISIIPYLIGSRDPSDTSTPDLDDQRLQAWQYVSDPGHPADPAWRCFKIKQIAQILPNPAPRPNPPVLDIDGQNCVRKW